jgi:hypothetical protein
MTGTFAVGLYLNFLFQPFALCLYKCGLTFACLDIKVAKISNEQVFKASMLAFLSLISRLALFACATRVSSALLPTAWGLC